MAKIISAFSHKGGVGKTNFIYNLGFALADKNHKVLLVDADSQMNLSSYVFGRSHNISYGKAKNTKEADVLEKKQEELAEEWRIFTNTYRSFPEHFSAYASNSGTANTNLEKPIFVHKKYKNIHLLAGSISLSQSELEWTDIVLGSRARTQQTRDLRPYYFEKSIKDLSEKYDYILIDTPPSSSSIITGLSVMSSDYFVVPTTPNFFSLQAVDNLEDILANWLDIFEKHKATGNYLGLSLKAKFLGTVVQKSRRYSRDEKKKNQYSKATIEWSNRVNERLDDFYKYALNNKTHSIERENFKKIFPASNPLIIDNICDFTLGLSSVAEECGMPVIHLTEKEFSYLSNPANNHSKAHKSVKESYEYISNCLDNL
jgi:chromosome partitioning protein